MLLQYNKPNRHTISYREKGNTDPNDVRELHLIPGINDVSDEVWAGAKKYLNAPHRSGVPGNNTMIPGAIDHLLKSRTIVERGNLTGEETDEVLIDIVENCVAVKLLAKIDHEFGNERLAVRDAVRLQFSKIEEAGSPQRADNLIEHSEQQ